MTSPLIPPQAVRRSPSPQLPHTVHLSGDTRAQVQVLPLEAGTTGAAVAGLPLESLFVLN